MKHTRRWAGLALASGVLILASACGDGPVKVDPPPATAENTSATGPTVPASALASGTAKATVTRDPNVFGTAPLLGDNVTKVSPPHAAQVPQLQTRVLDATRPSGICAEVTFDGLPENAQWFRMAVNGVEVTQKLSWFVATTTAPKEGSVCYALKDGFPPGRVQAALVVQNPNNVNEPTRQVVAWEFEVTK